MISPLRFALCHAVALLLLLLAAAAIAGESAGQAKKLSPAEIRLAGEMMYREGLLPSGQPLTALVSGDVPVDGRSFTCISCHLRSGLGSIEGTIVTPPTDGGNLYRPRITYNKGDVQNPAARRYALALAERPAYTDETLALALVDGIDAAGRVMNSAMPRYRLDRGDLAIMIAYLRTLSTERETAVVGNTINFATVLADDVGKEEATAMLQALDYYVKLKNGLADAYRKNPGAAKMALNMLGPELLNKRIMLKQWRLTGAPATWRAQLEEHYRQGPVLAILGGMAGDWAPVHKFCEDKQLPALFPFTEFPVIAENDWYTLYFSKGVYQEGEAAARYLNSLGELIQGKRIVQLVRDSKKGNALAAGFNAFWSGQGHAAPLSVTLAGTEPVTGKALQDIIDREKPAVLLLWDDDAIIPAVEALAASRNRPAVVLLSSGYLGDSLWRLGESARGYSYFTYPYRLPQDDARFDTLIKPLLPKQAVAEPVKRILKQGYIVNQMQSQALLEMRGNYNRDFLLDTIGMMPDMELPLYERISFGPGQRYASKGCYIVQLDRGVQPELVKRSDWIIH